MLNMLWIRVMGMTPLETLVQIVTCHEAPTQIRTRDGVEWNLTSSKWREMEDNE